MGQRYGLFLECANGGGKIEARAAGWGQGSRNAATSPQATQAAKTLKNVNYGFITLESFQKVRMIIHNLQ
jgi:hypothetical protein